MAMKTKEIDISKWEEDFPGAKVVIKKLTFGDYNDLQDEIVNIKFVGTQQIMNPDLGRAKILMVLKSLHEAPFEITEKAIRELDFDLGEYIFNEVDEFNSISPNSKTPSNEL